MSKMWRPICGGVGFYDFLEVSSLREMLKDEQDLFKSRVLQAAEESGQAHGCGECLELGPLLPEEDSC